MVSRYVLVLPRVFLGLIFSIAWIAKITSPVPFPTALQGFLQNMLPHAHPLYQAFAHAVVLPNVGFFAALVILGELYVSIGMLFGLTTRLASLVAVCLLLNYMLAKGMNLWSPASNDASDIVMAVVVALGAAGRSFGFDETLSKRFPRVPIW